MQDLLPTTCFRYVISIYIYLCQIQNVFSMCGSIQRKSGGSCNKRSTVTGDRVVKAAETTFQASTLLRQYLCLIFLVSILCHIFCMLSILPCNSKNKLSSVCVCVCVSMFACTCECTHMHVCIHSHTCLSASEPLNQMTDFHKS